MASEYAFRFTQKAVADLEELFRAVGQELANPAAAAGLGRKIFKCIDDLCAFPRAGKPVENDFLSDRAVRCLPIEHYLLFYKSDPASRTLFILRIVYGRRSLDEIFREL